MSDSMGSTPPSPLKKKGLNKVMVAVVAVVIVIGLVAVVVFSGLLAKAEPKDALEKIKQRGKLIVGTNVPWPPFEDYNITSGQYEGIDIEVITKVAEALGVTVEFKAMDFDALIGAVQTGQIDVAISSITIRPDRAESVDFSTPYYIADQAVLINDASSITNIDDLNGTTVGSQLGTTGSFWVTEQLVDTGRIPAANANEYDTIIAAVLVVQNGQKDAVVLDTPVAYKYANDSAYNLKVGFVIPTNEQYGIAIQKGQTALVSAINLAIETMKTDGTLQAIINKWA